MPSSRLLIMPFQILFVCHVLEMSTNLSTAWKTGNNTKFKNSKTTSSFPFSSIFYFNIIQFQLLYSKSCLGIWFNNCIFYQLSFDYCIILLLMVLIVAKGFLPNPIKFYLELQLPNGLFIFLACLLSLDFYLLSSKRFEGRDFFANWWLIVYLMCLFLFLLLSRGYVAFVKWKLF